MNKNLGNLWFRVAERLFRNEQISRSKRTAAPLNPEITDLRSMHDSASTVRPRTIGALYLLPNNVVGSLNSEMSKCPSSTSLMPRSEKDNSPAMVWESFWGSHHRPRREKSSFSDNSEVRDIRKKAGESARPR